MTDDLEQRVARMIGFTPWDQQSVMLKDEYRKQAVSVIALVHAAVADEIIAEKSRFAYEDGEDDHYLNGYLDGILVAARIADPSRAKAEQ